MIEKKHRTLVLDYLIYLMSNIDTPEGMKKIGRW